MNKQARSKLAGQLAETATKVAEFSFSALVDRLTRLSPEVQNAIFGMLVGGAGTGLVSGLTGGNVMSDSLLGMLLGGAVGGGGTLAYRHLTGARSLPSQSLSPEQRKAIADLTGSRFPTGDIAKGVGIGALGGTAAYQGHRRLADRYRGLSELGGLDRSTVTVPRDAAVAALGQQKGMESAVDKYREALTKRESGRAFGSARPWNRSLAAFTGAGPVADQANKAIRSEMIALLRQTRENKGRPKLNTPEMKRIRGTMSKKPFSSNLSSMRKLPKRFWAPAAIGGGLYGAHKLLSAGWGSEK